MISPTAKYCPICGSTLAEAQLPTEDRPRLVCSSCGHVYYFNPKVVSGTLPVQDGEVWLLRRGIEPRRGYWTHPAGFQEWDESTEQAAIRETREEIGCDVSLERLLGVYSRAGGPVVNVVYLARLRPGANPPCETVEAIEVRAFAPDAVPWEELAFQSTAQALRDWIEQLNSERQ
jgi:ADP-ribose pyrophosphatase YjhB (NUDIX family)